jgi:streptogramin lyase
MTNRLISAFSTLVFALLATTVAAQREDAPNQNPDQQYSVDGNWGQASGGAWDGSTSWITADGKGQVYVLVRDKPYVRIFTRDGSFVNAWSGPEDLGSAHSITIDDEGNAWLSDSQRHVIRKYSADGELLLTLGSPDEAGDNASQDKFNQPNHVFIANNRDIYVSDGYVNSRVVHFNPEGKFIRIIGGTRGTGPGEFQAVHGVALDSRGNILINDSENFRVQVFDKDARFVETWPYPSRGGIEILPDDTVYISDVNEGTVSIVKDGVLLDTAYAPRAHGLAVDSDGTLYTSGASRMTVFRLTMKK